MRSLVIGASGGIGAALARELAQHGEVVTLSRSVDGVDVTEEDSVAAALDRLDGSFDLVFVATGALGTPEKSLRALSSDELAAQFAVNTIGPALVLKHAVRLLPRGRRSVFAALSARVGSIGDNRLGGWYAYRASKAALNQMLHGASVEIARTHPEAIVALLHPGTVATSFTQDYPANNKVTPSEAARDLIRVLESLSPSQSGGFFDYAGNPIPW
ncbi:SDR family NAD(P)-dependent oxidoreductase [Albidovulum aquaemixtae]|nr:SDR family NAD(P)-dependent oxidoreductase [Defluviimonas aquaemixtae]